MAIFVLEFWPLFTTNEQRGFDYQASDGSGLRFASGLLLRRRLQLDALQEF